MTSKKVDAARRAVEQAAPEGKERRVVTARAELRANDNGTWRFEGDAAVFDKPSDDLGGGIFGGFREIIKRGAFKDALKDSDVRFLINHDANLLLARNTSGTLELSETPKALRAVVSEMPDVSYANDLRVLLDRGDLSQMSFGFIMGPNSEQEWHEDNEGDVTRTIHRVGELFDVSAVTFPAYPQTSAQARTICGITVFDGDDLDLERVKDVAWKVHRGDVVATEDERRHIDALLEPHSTVSPWIAERTLLAVASEPELLAAVPGKRAKVEIEPDADDATAFRVANTQRRLRQRAHLLGR